MSSRNATPSPNLSVPTEFSNAPLRSRVAAVLREAILNGELAPGAALTETLIAEQLQISRAPVREAIRTLAKEGLIVSEPYRGSRVRAITRRDVEEVYGLRGLHESFAVERILARGDAARFEPLVEVCDRMEAAAEREDMKAVTAEDDRFHRQLIELADHTLLASIWSQLSLRVRQIMSLRNLQMRDPRAVAANHRAIVDALRAGERDQALRRVREHVQSGAELVIDGWEEVA